MPEEAGAKNLYQCEECLLCIVTVNAVEGTTPFMTMCKVLPDCTGSMRSVMYAVSQAVEPGFEWYKPEGEDYDALDEETRVGHVDLGGLLLRPLPRRTPEERMADYHAMLRRAQRAREERGPRLRRKDE